MDGQDSGLSLSDLEKLRKLESEAFEKNMDVDYETLTLKPMGEPAWKDTPEEDERNYEQE